MNAVERFILMFTLLMLVVTQITLIQMSMRVQQLEYMLEHITQGIYE